MVFVILLSLVVFVIRLGLMRFPILVGWLVLAHVLHPGQLHFGLSCLQQVITEREPTFHQPKYRTHYLVHATRRLPYFLIGACFPAPKKI